MKTSIKTIEDSILAISTLQRLYIDFNIHLVVDMCIIDFNIHLVVDMCIIDFIYDYFN